MTGYADYFAEASRAISPAEPRVPCPCCGAHVIVALRVGDHIFIACPVCELRWAEDTTGRHDPWPSSARE